MDNNRQEVLAIEELKTAKPCPFCNRKPIYFVEQLACADTDHTDSYWNDETDLRNEDDGKWYTFSVFCLACEVNGPRKGSREQALTYWNRRF